VGEKEREMWTEKEQLTSTVGLVAIVRHSAVLVTVTDELFDDAAAVITLEIPRVFAIRRYTRHTRTQNYQQSGQVLSYESVRALSPATFISQTNTCDFESKRNLSTEARLAI